MITEEMVEVSARHSPVADASSACKWKSYTEGPLYMFRALLCHKDETGTIIAYSSSLPGVVSQGKTENEALKNIAEAFAGVIESYLEASEEIPWAPEKVERSPEDKERWVVAEVGNG